MSAHFGSNFNFNFIILLNNSAAVHAYILSLIRVLSARRERGHKWHEINIEKLISSHFAESSELASGVIKKRRYRWGSWLGRWVMSNGFRAGEKFWSKFEGKLSNSSWLLWKNPISVSKHSFHWCEFHTNQISHQDEQPSIQLWLNRYLFISTSQ